jgi:hypothetical protein
MSPAASSFARALTCNWSSATPAQAWRKRPSPISSSLSSPQGIGKGYGTRLATVYGIVKQSGGYVWVYSELGHGTDFKIYLPMVETLAESKARSQRSQEPLARGSETILLVEDDAALREVTCDFLRTSGYIVLTAGSPNKPFASRTLTIVRSTFS